MTLELSMHKRTEILPGHWCTCAAHSTHLSCKCMSYLCYRCGLSDWYQKSLAFTPNRNILGTIRTRSYRITRRRCMQSTKFSERPSKKTRSGRVISVGPTSVCSEKSSIGDRRQDDFRCHCLTVFSHIQLPIRNTAPATRLRLLETSCTTT